MPARRTHLVDELPAIGTLLGKRNPRSTARGYIDSSSDRAVGLEAESAPEAFGRGCSGDRKERSLNRGIRSEQGGRGSRAADGSLGRAGLRRGRIVAVDHEGGAATSIHSSSGPAHTRKVRLADVRPIRIRCKFRSRGPQSNGRKPTRAQPHKGAYHRSLELTRLRVVPYFLDIRHHRSEC